jgi:hypothetical protein
MLKETLHLIQSVEKLLAGAKLRKDDEALSSFLPT